MSTQLQNITSMLYNGSVDLSIKIKDKVINITGHNNGTDWLKKVFVRFLIGEKCTQADLPYYLDLRKYDTATEEWQSYLNILVPLSGRKADETDEKIAKFTATIEYSNLYSSILINSGNYRFYLMTGEDPLYQDVPSKLHHDLAYIDVSSETLSYIAPGTQAIITWKMKLLNEEEV